MRDEPVDLTIGNLWANIWHMSWPMLIIMLLNFLVGVVDVYVAGLIGPKVQAAVGFISQIYFLTIIIANAISIGSLALVSRAVGAREPGKAVEVARQSLMFGGIVAIAITIPGLVLYREIVALTGFPPEIREMAGHFLQVYAVALGANYLLIISNSIFRACGEVKKPLLTMTIVSMINIILNFLLVFGVSPFPKLGYIGIAVASAVSVTVGTLMNLLFFRFGSWAGIYKRPWTLSGEIIKKTLSISWPAALLQIAWNAGSIILYNVLSRLGDASITALAAITNGFRIEGIIFLPAFALNMAASVLIGQNLGAGNPERAEKVGWKIGMTGVVLMSSMALIIFISAEHIAASFTTDPAVLAETVRYLRYNMLSEPFMALSVVLGGGLQGAGDTRGTMWVVGTAMWVIRLPLAYIFALVMGFGATGVWIAMVISMVIQGILMARRFQGGKWKEQVL
ncbi:MAG TPA: MATE family efflux transporter [Dissulfurispiraceae bacterium]|nr:MATE family efflux transporter [Dissulfurispiraceae bacterium]